MHTFPRVNSSWHYSREAFSTVRSERASQHRNFFCGFHTSSNLKENSAGSARFWAPCVSNTHKCSFKWSLRSAADWTTALLAASSHTLAMIRRQDVRLFWPYSFSISPSIQKMDGSHLEGKSWVTLSSYRPATFSFFLPFYSSCTCTAVKHTSNEGLLPCHHCSLLIIPPVLIISHPLPVVGFHADVLGSAFLPPSYIISRWVENDASVHDG